MSAKEYNKLFPRCVRYKQDRPVPSLGIIPPWVEVPLYRLGWMVKVKNIGRYCGGYGGVRQYLIVPNWVKHGCEPRESRDFDRTGLIHPNVWLFGRDHVFLQIAHNSPASMGYLHTEAGLKKVIDQALLAFGIKEGAFDPLANLLWIRWPTGDKFPEVKFPCIGEHYWPDEVEQKASEALTGSDQEEKEEKLPQVAPEIVSIITREFYA